MALYDIDIEQFAKLRTRQSCIVSLLHVLCIVYLHLTPNLAEITDACSMITFSGSQGMAIMNGALIIVCTYYVCTILYPDV